MKALITNYMLVMPLLAWVAAQTMKGIIYAVRNSKFDFRRMLGTGDMPSSHSATVAALVTAAIKKNGAGSAVTAVCFVLAIIVIHDALTLRTQTGKHAKALNTIVKDMNTDENVKADKFNEKAGHSFLQVLAGIILGIGISLIVPVF